jgi:4-amino-4-deoxy-L-arabinose transferase-like glycosyltransferase
VTLDDEPASPWLATEPAVLWLLFFAALVPRLLFVTLVHPPGDHVVSDMWVFDLRAKHLVSGELGPWDTFTPAGYPAFLACFYATVGRELTFIGMVQALLSALTVVLTYVLAVEISRDRRIGWLAAIAIVLHVPTVLYSGLLLSETLFSFLIVLASYLLLRAVSKASLGLSGWAGLVLGIAGVVRPPLLLALPLVPIFFFFALGRSAGRAAGYSAVVLAIALVPLAAHSWHNSRLVDRWVPTSTNGGLNFYLNLAEVRSVKFKEGSYTHQITPIPNLIRYDRDERVERPFYDDRHFYAEGWRLLADRPLRVLKGFWSLKETLGLGRQEYWPGWPPWRTLLGAESRVFAILFVLPGLFGLGLLVRRGIPFRPEGAGWVWIAGLIAASLLAAAAYLGDPRIRVPYDPLYVIAAGFAYVELARWVRTRRAAEK